MNKVSLDFFEQLFEKEDGLPSIIPEIRFKDDGSPVYHSATRDTGTLLPKKLHSIKFVPDYLHLKLPMDGFTLETFGQVKGYSVNVTGFTDVGAYLKSQFKSNAKTIKRYVTRLEACFPISYRLFYGEISQTEYDHILDTLEQMLRNRFMQRRDSDESRKKWDRVRKETFDFIHAKKASLFVIYDGIKPIEISINYHFKNILFSSISSYDIYYSKFGLGHVEIYKQLEWCMNNGYKIFEMGRGDLDYKRRWSNTIYTFEQFVLTPKNNPGAYLQSIFLSNFLRLKGYLKSKKVHLYVKRLIEVITRNVTAHRAEVTYKIEELPSQSIKSCQPKIDLDDSAYEFLRKPVYDILYQKTIPISKISLYEVQKERHYILESQKEQYVILLKPNI
ncbi:GNAT family N-acetyltransferase [Arenibacter sp. GZD96]|uniref:GNAT family N-acetyltransferase n=1 Tax=Aurantibrevibacter litoralis TaxID=3106030 RepID=UPI002AFE040A|nr:GNAT family N-acetyltransferase [Arenibacter sp. GZD-96]MEA1787387.1 GNAT family N-acetyltransferase [Arenibacter sp. GZD-96]